MKKPRGNMILQDTIFALATPAGGALAVVRVSGPKTLTLYKKVFTGKAAHARMTHGFLKDGETVLDDVMAVFFEAPKSYTGEDMAEFYTHGGQAVLNKVLSLLLKEARLAQPGEFTRRAFLNGKMDLSQAEAVQDMIASLSARGASLALEQLQGSVSRAIKETESKIMDALCGIEASIDYPEELEEDVFSALPRTLSAAREEINALIEGGLRQKALREGARVVLLGRPNAGKSSLLNALLGYDRAIVTAHAGTTRDVLEEETLFYDVPVRLTDTAGVRESGDEAERIGVERAKNAAHNADFLLLIFDGAEELSFEDRELLRFFKDKPCIAVVCKSDLSAKITPAKLRKGYKVTAMGVSAKTGEGVDKLKRAVAERLVPGDEGALITNARHISTLLRAETALKSALEAFEPELVATDLRDALRALGEITGETADEAVIDRIFEKFCVGK